ncbi:GNAT family N-acetyltransferase [Flagellimonas allohymeniacidonis]|uniref:GNAT family N-acetyltransferase n=1 Tax=Flagellimonas allohymeniacidonis TaxID=2517819 RepID=A0A4Q8QF43_9FLAO|nr:GNAT family N-acetyltransferase [Allomuricauda hymeniacidonis]TAI49095.1 GNAT family N-acetyltransferase [Allomuricauda hymeniacidonis]
MQIKQANISDLELLVPLFDAYRQFYEQKTDKDSAREFLKERFQKEENIVFMAMLNNQAIGFTQLYATFSSVSMKPFYILNDLYVNSEHRHMGIGEALLEKAKDHCAKKNFKGLALETALDNPAQNLYERLGWKKDEAYLHYFWSNPE